MATEVTNSRHKLEPLLGGVALLLLLAGCVVVVLPFMSALMWAIVLAFSLYPLQRRFTRWFRGSRTLAACLVSLTITVIVAGPMVWIGFTLAEDAKALTEATRKWFMSMPDEAPDWTHRVPLIGPEVNDYWKEFADGRKQWMEQLEHAAQPPPAAPRPTKRYIEKPDGTLEEVDIAPIPGSEEPVPAVVPATTDSTAHPDADAKKESPKLVTLLGKILSGARTLLIAAGRGLTVMLVSAFLAFFLLRDAEVLATRLSVAVDRLTGGRGLRLLNVAGATVKGVIYGILGTALAQALVAGLGFWIAGVPGAVLLGVLTFFFAVIPFGPPVVWIPAALWLFNQDRPGWGLFMLLWGLLGISSVDNVLRPALISQGSKLPFALIFCGVVGGALAFGLVGVFLGPTLLAVAYRLIDEWTDGVDQPGELDPAS